MAWAKPLKNEPAQVCWGARTSRGLAQVFVRFAFRRGGFRAFATSRFAAAVITPRAAPAQALAALSQRLSSGFFFVQGFAIAPRNAAGRGLLPRHPAQVPS